MIEYSEDNDSTTSLPSTGDISESNDTVITAPPTKKVKGLNKFLGQFQSKSQPHAGADLGFAEGRG